jgi:hypothetical protein
MLFFNKGVIPPLNPRNNLRADVVFTNDIGVPDSRIKSFPILHGIGGK